MIKVQIGGNKKSPKKGDFFQLFLPIIDNR